MKEDDRSDRFVTPFSKLLIIRDGKAFRGDGKPLTDADRERVAGRDPLAKQLEELRIEEEIKDHINFLLRQAGLDHFPAKVPMSDWLRARVDEATAQGIYQEWLAEQRQHTLSEMTPDSLEELAREIMNQGIDEKTAWHYAALIGDTPITDEAGTCVIVMDGNKELARLKPLKCFDMI